MKQTLLIILVFLCIKDSYTQVLPLIPMPDKVTPSGEKFIINKKTVIVTAKENSAEAEYLKGKLKVRTGMELQLVYNIPEHGANYIKLESGSSDRSSYSLTSSEAQIIISSGNSDGIFYGIQTFLQLLPVESSKKVKFPCVSICDSPGFKWRGMHLDCSRHFFTPDEVKKYLDYMAMYKMNVFHWHLTDDQGWRIEIKKYPELAEISSKRKETLIGKPSENNKFDGIPYGGYYTQEQIKDIVAYAKKLHITVVPEIEMPGHALAALSAYPELSCTGGPFEVGTTWGVFEDVFCAGNEETFEFINNVLDEVCELFPGKYIHIGGDECPKVRWMECPKCKARIKNENLKDESELQSYFIRRVEKHLNSKGRQIIGWDEILEGGLAPNAAVMSWRGEKGGIEAASQKHYVVMSPGRPCYFDHYQNPDKEKEPLAIGGYNPVDSVYNYNPVPDELAKDEAEFIMGAQGNMWAEYLPAFSNVEYMALPRMAALAEALWTKQENKNFISFKERFKIQSAVLDKMGVNYCKKIKEQ